MSGKIVIPSGGDATGHHLCLQRWCQQPIYTTGNPADKLTHFFSPSPSHLSSILWKVATLRRITCWKALPLHLIKLVQWWCGLSSPVSCSQASFPPHQSPGPVRSSARTNQRSWGGLIFTDSDQNIANIMHGQKASIHKNSTWFPTYTSPSFLFRQVFCLMFRAPDRSSGRSIMCSSLNPIQQINGDW